MSGKKRSQPSAQGRKAGVTDDPPESHGVRGDRQHILGEKMPFALIEEYKMLRTAVTFAASTGGETCKLIGVTSPLHSEGKSITCLNLAIAFALTQVRVLLLDCDLRKPNIAPLLSISAAPGVSNVLANMCGVSKAVCKLRRHDARLDVVPSGDIPPNPSELLGSERAGAVLTALSQSYDYIFVDLPPALLVSDAMALSRHLSGLVAVIRAGQTKKDDVLLTLERFRLANANVLGFVLNGAPRASAKRYYASKYGQYA
ncbi:MAG: CpsD/CapB family tyrosine-protein kinase [Oscillospiraceae bacterium]|jgi:capsular exopolysaccharide synthesis family protein|nr:CpsD/CapB family tyrosine-protein kinase [Oscillospiraceae bacterium]